MRADYKKANTSLIKKVGIDRSVLRGAPMGQSNGHEGDRHFRLHWETGRVSQIRGKTLQDAVERAELPHGLLTRVLKLYQELHTTGGISQPIFYKDGTGKIEH